MWFHSLFDALSVRSSRTRSRKRRSATSIRRRPCFFLPRLEMLEDRTLLSTYVVNSLTDTDKGSHLTGDLRYCVTNATSGNDTITFAPVLAGTIQLQSNLPTLNASVDIQGPGAKVITVSPGGRDAFTVDSGAQVQFSGLTLFDGLILAKDGSAIVSNCALDDSALVIDQTTDTSAALTVSNCALDKTAIVNGNTSAALTVSNCTFSDVGEGSGRNDISNDGSAIISYTTLSGIIENSGSETISYSTISGYTGGNGLGAIYNSGNLTIDNSTISGNQAVGTPAYAVATYSGAFTFNGGNGMGGGIYMGGGTLSINSSTIADNEAIGGSTGSTSIAGNGLGGGLYIASGTVSINNSTFADNQTFGGAGPIYGPGQGYGGGIYNAAGPSALQMHDTIVADNTANVAPDLYGSVSSLGYNLIGNSTGGSGYAASDLVNINPQLGPLQNNGGPTQTMALLAGSPAINTGDNSNAPAYDQRGPGFARIVNGTIDIGAFEVQNGNSGQASSLTVTGFPSIITAGNAGSFTVTALNADGTTDTGYEGTIQFTSTDGQAVLPADYTFTTADAGVHTFTATLKTAGTQSITAKDNFGLTGSDTGITVKAAAASKFVITAPSSVQHGVPFSLTVTVEDPYGNVVTGYTGTIHFGSTDSRAKLPADYTFTASDNGVHTFTGLVLRKAGNQKITITDTQNSSIAGSAFVGVL